MSNAREFQYDIFFSFSNQDSTIAKSIWTFLSDKGLKVFWSESTLKNSLGQSWYDKLEESLENSRHFMVLYTRNALKSEWVRREYKAFLNFCYKKNERRLIPLLSRDIDISDLPLFLREFQVFQYENNQDLEELLQLVIETGNIPGIVEKTSENKNPEIKLLIKEQPLNNLQNIITKPDYEGQLQPKFSVFVDPRDKKSYKTVKINNQVWFAENLAFKTPESVVYQNNIQFENQYGRLYTWSNSFEACPNGWKIPDQYDWDELIYYLGGFNMAGGKMKDNQSGLWKSPNRGADNNSGFSALPAGMGVEDFFGYMSITACFWSNHEYDKVLAWRMALGHNSSAIQRDYREKTIYLSVRCILK